MCSNQTQQGYLFPGSLPNYNDILYIIGNGFDIAHGINSKYSDFKKYVKGSGDNNLIRMMDTFFSNKRDFWSDVETALGEYDESVIMDYCSPDEEIDYDHMMRSVAAIEDGPDWIFEPVLDLFKQTFGKWVDSINISNAVREFELSPSSLYLTFNYTETLESVYGIPSENVLHIHGSRLAKNDEYIVGHNNFQNPDKHSDPKEYYFHEDTKNKIINMMNGLFKDTKAIANKNEFFWNSLNHINTVIVRGHSLYDVDWEYFDRVVASTTKNTKWIFYYFCGTDKIQIDKYISHAGLQNCEFKQV